MAKTLSQLGLTSIDDVDVGDAEKYSWDVDSDGKIARRVISEATLSENQISSGSYGAKSITGTPAIAAVGASNLSNRNLLIFTPTNGDVYWGFNNSVTTSSGQQVLEDQTVTLRLSADTVEIYLVSGGTVNVRITEAVLG